MSSPVYLTNAVPREKVFEDLVNVEQDQVRVSDVEIYFFSGILLVFLW